MDLELKGKVALVTGASRGIGLGIARCLAAEGADLFICARTEEPLHAAAAQLSEAGVEVGSEVADVTSPDESERVVAAACDRHGGFDILVNNVGGSVWTPFADITDEEWDRVFSPEFLLGRTSVEGCSTGHGKAGKGQHHQHLLDFRSRDGRSGLLQRRQGGDDQHDSQFRQGSGSKEYSCQYCCPLGPSSFPAEAGNAAGRRIRRGSPSSWRTISLRAGSEPPRKWRRRSLFSLRRRSQLGDWSVHQCRWGTVEVEHLTSSPTEFSGRRSSFHRIRKRNSVICLCGGGGAMNNGLVRPPGAAALDTGVGEAWRVGTGSCDPPFTGLYASQPFF